MVLKSNHYSFHKMNPRPTEPDSNFTALLYRKKLKKKNLNNKIVSRKMF